MIRYSKIDKAVRKRERERGGGWVGWRWGGGGGVLLSIITMSPTTRPNDRTEEADRSR